MKYFLKRGKQQGFTIVELLVVIVVVGILASISTVAYSGVQARARDSQRHQDIQTIVKALDAYYLDNGEFPPGSCSSSCVINGVWSNTNDGSWANLRNALVPDYISELPTDPSPTIGTNPQSATAFGYGYYANTGTYCGTSVRQMYILIYDLEAAPQQNTLNGGCATNVLGPYSNKSNYRVTVGVG